MRAARLHGIGDLRVEQVPDPVPGAGERLVRVTAVGLCGSDLHWYTDGGIGDAQLDRPLVLGHEISAELEDGTPVAVDPAVPCGDCPRCREGSGNLCPHVRFAGHSDTDGGLRELMAWPADRLHRLPTGLDPAAATLLEPLGVALHALDLAHVRLGARTAVVGCGPIGLLLVTLLRASGAASVTVREPLAHRLAAAAALGADPDGPGECDVVLEVSGSRAALAESVALTRPGGRLVLVGIPDDDVTYVPAGAARRRGLTIAVARRMGETYPRALDLVVRGVVDPGPLVTGRVPLQQAGRAFRTAAARTGLKTTVLV